MGVQIDEDNEKVTLVTEIAEDEYEIGEELNFNRDKNDYFNNMGTAFGFYKNFIGDKKWVLHQPSTLVLHDGTVYHATLGDEDTGPILANPDIELSDDFDECYAFLQEWEDAPIQEKIEKGHDKKVSLEEIEENPDYKPLIREY